jgi:hypothetical protein
MKNIIEKELLNDLDFIQKSNIEEDKKDSFASGYSNGFVRGSSFIMERVGLLIGIPLIISIIANIILLLK